MWIQPDYKGTLEELIKEVQNALFKFEKDDVDGKLTPVDDNDKSNWC
jgi:hypothetical protein